MILKIILLLYLIFIILHINKLNHYIKMTLFNYILLKLINLFLLIVFKVLQLINTYLIIHI